MLQPKSIKESIQQGLPDAEVIVTGDDGTHFEAVVISAQFEGKSLLQQHQLVYHTLGDRFTQDIHALALKTYTPVAWQTKQSSSK
ncbi:MAG TPA: BolA family transcriptional regulator [Gammaproteobacteria bacterium]|nr:BolA family transcriptional regulator [Gammaproteobacteria bacterium]